MVRKLCALGLLLMLVAGGYSLAAEPEKPAKQERSGKQENRDNRAADSQRKARAKDGTYDVHVCVLQLWLDYPGDTDLWVADAFLTDCGDAPTPELWSGTPTQELPEDCPLCEGYGGKAVRGAAIPPHKMALDKTNAWRMLQAGLEAAKINTLPMKPAYYTIPVASLPADMQTDYPNGIDVIAVLMPPPQHHTENFYLCIQTRKLPSNVVTSLSCTATHGPGSQLIIEFDEGGKHREGFVWLSTWQKPPEHG
jgi:hypothetical protein